MGAPQRVIYGQALSVAMDALTEHPHLRRPRDDIRPGLRGLAVNNHLLLYRVSDTAIRVLPIIHTRKDLDGDLEI